jgi:uncharacterized protein YggE
VSKGKRIYIERRSILCIATILVFLTTVARAQTPVSIRSGAASDSEIVASGTGEVSAAPAKAVFTMEIKTLAATAAAASAENARLSRAVMDALRAASVRTEEIVGTQLSVGANWSYDESARRQKRTAYQAINSIQIQTVQLDKVAAYIDAALSAGATGSNDGDLFCEGPASDAQPGIE